MAISIAFFEDEADARRFGDPRLEPEVDWVQHTEDAWPPLLVGERFFLVAPWREEPTPPGPHSPGDQSRLAVRNRPASLHAAVPGGDGAGDPAGRFGARRRQRIGDSVASRRSCWGRGGWWPAIIDATRPRSPCRSSWEAWTRCARGLRRGGGEYQRGRDRGCCGRSSRGLPAGGFYRGFRMSGASGPAWSAEGSQGGAVPLDRSRPPGRLGRRCEDPDLGEREFLQWR